ncbi:MAG TPA: ATP-binding domain-containing protein [Candidatus Binatia bacterium]|nr:ATP-binding domain-containing protein [Candidatus Binatia bacterium]
MSERVIAEEERLLADVISRLERGSGTSAPSEASIVAELEQLRAALREGAKAEDRPALLQQWDRQSALLQQLRTATRPTEVDPGSPYFAHLRLDEDGVAHDILLGKTTRVLPGAPIVDWRNAPISRVFYRYRQGEAYEEEIAGRPRAGTVAARRTVTIRDRRLRRIEAPEGLFQADAGGWRRLETDPPRLGGASGTLRAHDVRSGEHGRLAHEGRGFRRRVDKHLPDIAGLIDPEQFELITRPSAGFVVIRGTAGSGKTTVALHRIAYLAYDDPAVDSADTLVAVFSPALRDYVSHVLPALGVTRVQVRTFQEWAAEQRRRLFPDLPRDVRELTPAVVQRVKLHPALETALRRQVARVPGPPTARQAIDDWTSVLADHALLAETLGADVGPDALRRAVDWMRARGEELAAWRAGDRDGDAALDEADEALLLRAWQLRVGPLPGRGGRPLRLRHVAVDEVQDLAPLDVRVLLDCLDDRRSITLAGDTHQHVVEEGGFTSWTAFLGHLGLAGTAVDTLRVSYRCTSEIAAFADALLGDLREEPVAPQTTRSGPPVELFRFTDHGAAVAYLGDALQELATAEPLASVALLTPSAELSALYHRGLAASDVPGLHRVVRHDFRFAPGVQVTEIEQAKGLEFDYVVLVEASSTHLPDTPATRRRLHVGATRAVHQLWVTSVGTPAAPVRALLGTPS